MPATVLPSTPENIARVAHHLRAGGIAAMPTETVYGLAGVAFNELALAAIFSTKERPTFDPLICHVALAHGAAEQDWAAELARQRLVDSHGLSATALQHLQSLATAFWPGPLTLVLPKSVDVPDLATSGLPTVGVRCPAHPVAQQLLAAVGVPLAAPSANRFGRISPTAASHVAAELGDRIEFILDGGACEIGIESTVLLIEPTGGLRLLRPGAVTMQEIASATGGEVMPREALPENAETPLPAPGLLASHYAPAKPLFLFARRFSAMSAEERSAWARKLDVTKGVGLVLSSGSTDDARRILAGAGIRFQCAALSEQGDLAEAARRLFSTLRQLDEDPGISVIWAELMLGNDGLAFAINDRLTKASAQR